MVYTVTKPDILKDPSYHPDGGLVFVECIDSTWQISTLSNDATPEYTVLISGLLPYADPYYSVDGTFIIFATQMSGETMDAEFGVWSLFYMYADGSGLTTIIDDGNANMHPAWVTPIQIAFQSWTYGVSTAFQLSLIDLAGQGRVDIGEGTYPRTVTA